MKILLVEDEEMLNHVIAKRLRLENITVDACFDGARAYEHLQTSGYELVIADIMMPHLDGISLLKKIREKGNNIPILIITARDSLDDKLEGLNSGADDYLVKPFDLEELVARVHALIRRSTQKGTATLQIGPLEINLQARSVKVNGQPVTMTTKEFDLLYYLATNEHIVLTRQQILDHVWEYDYESYSNLIDVYIKDLRKKVDIDPERKLIHTVRGVGYVFKASEE